MGSKVPQKNACKVVLLGEGGCGKSCLLKRFMYDAFDPLTQATIGAAFGTKTLQTKIGPILLNIWDTAGSEKYRCVVNLYYREAKAAIVCCDLTDLDTFKQLQYWIDQLQREEENCKIYICGTKFDLIRDGIRNRAITSSDLEMFNAKVFETSSKTGWNVSTLFQVIADEYISKENQDKEKTVMLNEASDQKDEDKKSKKCCSSA